MITGTVRYGTFFSFATSLFLIVNKICKTPYKLSNELRIVLWSRSILARPQLVKMAAPDPAPALAL